MSDKSKLEDRSIEDPSPQQLREELEKHVRHMLDRNSDELEFALMVTGFGEADGGTRVCTMLGGPPQTIARIITELMDELVKRNPAFAIFFLMSVIQRMPGNQDMSEVDVEAQVKDLIDKLRGDTPPNGSVH